MTAKRPQIQRSASVFESLVGSSVSSMHRALGFPSTWAYVPIVFLGSLRTLDAAKPRSEASPRSRLQQTELFNGAADQQARRKTAEVRPGSRCPPMGRRGGLVVPTAPAAVKRNPMKARSASGPPGAAIRTF